MNDNSNVMQPTPIRRSSRAIPGGSTSTTPHNLTHVHIHGLAGLGGGVGNDLLQQDIARSLPSFVPVAADDDGGGGGGGGADDRGAAPDTDAPIKGTAVEQETDDSGSTGLGRLFGANKGKNKAQTQIDEDDFEDVFKAKDEFPQLSVQDYSTVKKDKDGNSYVIKLPEN